MFLRFELPFHNSSNKGTRWIALPLFIELGCQLPGIAKIASAPAIDIAGEWELLFVHAWWRTLCLNPQLDAA